MQNQQTKIPGPGDFSPADPVPSIHDFNGAAASALEDAGIPDFVADALADLSARGYTPAALQDFGRWAFRHIDPLLEQAQRDRCRAAA